MYLAFTYGKTKQQKGPPQRSFIDINKDGAVIAAPLSICPQTYTPIHILLSTETKHTIHFNIATTFTCLVFPSNYLECANTQVSHMNEL